MHQLGSSFAGHLDLDSIIGLLMLVGIVKKNAILRSDYTNQLLRK
jgi:multidrug efflux pump subunit AcrB